jgi:NAD(P) transhydrogenase subunit alpha
LALAIGLGFVTDAAFIINFGIFIMAVFAGYLVVWNVSPSLHTPLMSVTNAISGIIVIGCMLTVNNFDQQRDTWFETYSICGFVGLAFASINVVGGFVVTQRMLNMFKK